ncbi:MAG: hypothetical protein M1480_19205 [Bacteroidetes bacterium]|nr:hypothetical protein [Bacteroidota bacterium]MCL5031138.1 hypothetical protein [Bacteroidota bacterium]
MNKKIILLKSELELMNNASSILNYSFKKCIRIGKKKEYTQKESDAFENLASRFARLNDIILQKILRSIHLIDLDDAGTLRDSINLAEKKRIIADADKMIEMRELRNSIVHEYIPEVIKNIFAKSMELTPSLLKNVELINRYCHSKYKI